MKPSTRPPQACRPYLGCSFFHPFSQLLASYAPRSKDAASMPVVFISSSYPVQCHFDIDISEAFLQRGDRHRFVNDAPIARAIITARAKDLAPVAPVRVIGYVDEKVVARR